MSKNYKGFYDLQVIWTDSTELSTKATSYTHFKDWFGCISMGSETMPRGISGSPSGIALERREYLIPDASLKYLKRGSKQRSIVNYNTISRFPIIR